LGVAQGQPAPGAAAGAAAAGAAAGAGADPVQRLQQLKDLLDKGLITPADYDTAKAEVLKKLTS
ncbi:SHOCT domain-containing protein, partial [Achromobacter xylosoxidans]